MLFFITDVVFHYNLHIGIGQEGIEDKRALCSMGHVFQK